MKFAVIGGGLAGLVFGAMAVKDGHKVVIYEKNPVAGGVLTLCQVGDYHFEQGPLLMCDLLPGEPMSNLLAQFGIHLDLGERKVLCDNLLHLGLDGIDLLIRDEADLAPSVFHPCLLVDLAIQAARQGVVDHQDFFGIKLPDRVLKYEAERAEVAPPSVGMVEPYELHLMEEHGPVIEFLEFIVDKSGDHIQFLARLGVRYAAAPLL